MTKATACKQHARLQHTHKLPCQNLFQVAVKRLSAYMFIMTAEHACSYVGGAGRDNRQDTSGSAPHLGWRMCIGACACVGRRKMMSQPSRGCHNNPMDWNPGKMNNRPKLHPNYKCASAHSLWNPSAHTSRSSQRRAFSNTINSVRHCAAMYAQLLRSKG